MSCFSPHISDSFYIFKHIYGFYNLYLKSLLYEVLGSLILMFLGLLTLAYSWITSLNVLKFSIKSSCLQAFHLWYPGCPKLMACSSKKILFLFLPIPQGITRGVPIGFSDHTGGIKKPKLKSICLQIFRRDFFFLTKNPTKTDNKPFILWLVDEFFTIHILFYWGCIYLQVLVLFRPHF